jgi:hypothetical protein
MMSFLRSVIVEEAVVVEVADVAVWQPAVVVEHVAASRLVVVVAGEDGVRADEDLAVVGDADSTPGSALPTVPNCEDVRAVHGRGGRALGEPVALEDQDVERVEELRRSRVRAARRPRSP